MNISHNIYINIAVTFINNNDAIMMIMMTAMTTIVVMMMMTTMMMMINDNNATVSCIIYVAMSWYHLIFCYVRSKLCDSSNNRFCSGLAKDSGPHFLTIANALRDDSAT